MRGWDIPVQTTRLGKDIYTVSGTISLSLSCVVFKSCQKYTEIYTWNHILVYRKGSRETHRKSHGTFQVGDKGTCNSGPSINLSFVFNCYFFVACVTTILD